MTTRYEIIFHEMINGINNCQASARVDMSESCFWIASKHWETVKNNTPETYFENLRNTIDFFKNVKPKFTSQVQYFTILSEASLFVPDFKDDKVEYWSNELKRYRRYYKINDDFIQYYTSGKVDMDSTYFKRVDQKWQSPQPLPSYDKDKKFCSSHDQFIRGFLAEKCTTNML